MYQLMFQKMQLIPLYIVLKCTLYVVYKVEFKLNWIVPEFNVHYVYKQLFFLKLRIALNRLFQVETGFVST